jgi:thiamine-monophosphate kinase
VTEFELIRLLKPALPGNDQVVDGAGDDCAVLDLGAPGMVTLLKTDAVVEGVHFESGESPVRIGHKAMGRCLSDMAAMGGLPVAAVVTLGLPEGWHPDRIEGIYQGLCALAARWRTAVVGGEVTRNPGGLFINVCLVGSATRESVVRRAGASPGDGIFVTGELGGSLEGRHLDFEPRLAEGRWLAEGGWASSMIDLSDGLAGDLPHLLEASGGIGAELRMESIPVSRAAKLRGARGDMARPPLLAALCDGEDFELLFTVRPGKAVALLDGWKAAFPSVRLTCIGRIETKPGVRLREGTGFRPMPGGGFEHFAGVEGN